MNLRVTHRASLGLWVAVASLLTLSLEQAVISQVAQQDKSSSLLEKCPTISVSSPSSLDYEKPLTFSALVNGIAPDTIRYDWEVSVGTILEGQGTGTIKVDISGMGGQAITASVTIYGLAKSCHTQASCSLLPGIPPPPAVLFDTYYPKALGAAAPRMTRRRRRPIRPN
jgi:hypothetical protein